LREAKFLEEAWWNCLWLVLQPKIKAFREIEKKLASEDPSVYVTQDDTETLHEYLVMGILSGRWIEQKSGGKTYRLRVDIGPLWCEREGIEQETNTLLVQPAYAIARQIEAFYSGEHYQVKCHAPSCGKVFMTGDRRKLLCPGSSKRDKSSCGLEWQRYRKYLIDKNQDPEDVWDREEFKNAFR